MAGNGPAPSHNPKRSNPRVGVTVLPADGRPGDPPEWPLSAASKAERSAWVELWSSPQAVAWGRMGWTRVVARYCRVLVESERRNSTTAVRSEARQLEDRLGLTPKSMRALLWVVSEDEVGARRADARATSAPRRRLVAVDEPEAAGESGA